MKIKIGCDIVKIEKFNNPSQELLNKIFHKSELTNSKLKSETLAGIFAVKECCKKIFNDLNWHDIEIKKSRNGKPFLILNKHKVKDYDLSISHDGDYAIAVVVFCVEDVKIKNG